MSEVKRYRVGDRLTYIRTGKTVWVFHNTLNAGGVNSDEAVVFVAEKHGILIAVPVAIQDDFLRPYSPPVRVQDTDMEETDGEEEIEV